MIILPPDTMSAEDIKKMEENGICVVVANDPAKVRFVDPIPAASSRTQIENAAINFSRKLLSKGEWESHSMDFGDICKWFCACLVIGTPLDPSGTAEDLRQDVYNEAYFMTLSESAVKDAEEESARIKAEKAEEKKRAKEATKATEKKSDAK